MTAVGVSVSTIRLATLSPEIPGVWQHATCFGMLARLLHHGNTARARLAAQYKELHCEESSPTRR